MHNKDHRKTLFVCLPKYRTYEARYRMFCMAVEYGWDVTMVLLHGPHPKDQQFEKINQVTVPENKGYFGRGAFWRELFSHVPRDTPVVIQDTFQAQMARSFSGHNFWGRMVRPNVRNILSSYSPTPGYLFQGHWLLPREVRLTVRQKMYDIKRYVSIAALEWYSLRFMDALVANSQDTLDDACRYYGFPKGKTKMISAEFDGSFFSPGPSRRSELDLPQEGPILLYVGNRQRRKGIDIALKALGLLRGAYPEARLVMVGGERDAAKGWYKRFMGDNLERNVIIRDTVTPAELRDYYRSSDVFFLPTRHEGSPRVVKEALACGCPVVASDVPGVRSIDPAGKAVCISNSNTASCHAEMLCNLLQNKELQERRKTASVSVLSELTCRKTVLKYIELYDSLF